jgi:hypothetical protein
LNQYPRDDNGISRWFILFRYPMRARRHARADTKVERYYESGVIELFGPKGISFVTTLGKP